MYRSTDLKAKLAKSWSASEFCHDPDGAEIAEQHGTAANEGDGQGERGGQRVGHDGVERALTHLPHEHAAQVVGLGARGPREQGAQDHLARARRSRTDRVLQLADRHIDIVHRQRRCRRGRDIDAERGGPADTDASLSWLADE